LAVIKQQRTTFASPIGVVRANTGAGDVFRGVNKIADQMIENSFQDAKAKALEAGKDLAMSEDLGSLRSINPETNLPEMSLMGSIKAPDRFGSVAQKAYKVAIEARYVNQIEQDFKAQAKLLYARHKDSPEGLQLFKDGFGLFIDESVQHVDPRFKGVVQSVGASLLASNTVNFMEKQIVRERDETVGDWQNEFTSAVSGLQILWSTNDANSQEAALLEQRRLLARNFAMKASGMYGENAETISTGYINQLLKTRVSGTISRMAVAVGANPELTSITLNEVRSVIQNNGIGLDELPEELQSIASELINMEVATDFQTKEDGTVDAIAFGKRFAEIKDSALSELSDAQSRLNTREVNEKSLETEKDREDREDALLDKQENENGILSDRTKTVANIDALLASSDLPTALNEFYNFKDRMDALTKPTDGSAIKSTVTNEAIRRTRQHLFQGLVIAVGSNLNTKQYQEFESYITTNRGTGNPTPESKVIADAILDNKDAAVDSRQLARDLRAIVTQKLAVDVKNNQTTSFNTAFTELTSGQSIAGNKQQGKVMDKVVAGEDPKFFLRESSFGSRNEWGAKVINLNKLPLALEQNLKSFVSGTKFGETQQRQFLQYYDMFSRVPSRDGSAGVVNMWDGVLTAKEQGLLEATLQISSIEGSDLVPEIMDNIRNVRNNPDAYRDQIKNMFPEGVDEFLTTLTTDSYFFKADVANPNVTRELRGYIEYQIASLISRDDIEDNIVNFVSTHYKPTEGLVIDTTSGIVNKSRQSLQVAFPDAKDRATIVEFMNQKIFENFGMTQKLFKADIDVSAFGEMDSVSGYREVQTGATMPNVFDRNKLFLMPLQGAGNFTASSDNSRYIVMEKTVNGGYRPFMPTPPVDTEGDDSVTMMPTMVQFSINQMRQAVMSTKPKTKTNAATEEQKILKERQMKAGNLYPDGVSLFGTTIASEAFNR